MTTANYPNVELSAYQMSTWYLIFFIGYEIVGLYFLQNVLVAAFYSNYVNRVEEQIEEFEKKRSKYLKMKFYSF